MKCKNKNQPCNSCGEKKCGNKHTTCHNADVVEVRHGEWIRREIEKEEITRSGWIVKKCIPTFTCSLCKEEIIGLVNMHYCPNCGAKMKYESESKQ